MKILSFILSMLVISLSVIVLVLFSVISMIFNGVLFLLMIAGLSIPMAGNTLAGKFLPSKRD
jgi:hypothetical protein